MSFDVDDVGAICAAHALHDNREATLLAVMLDTGYPEAVGAASVLSEWYGHSGEVRLGAYQGPFGRDHRGRWVEGLYVKKLVAGRGRAFRCEGGRPVTASPATHAPRILSPCPPPPPPLTTTSISLPPSPPRARARGGQKR